MLWDMNVKTIRVVTLNTWKCSGDYARRLRRMAEGLRALAPDLILLQEVFATIDGARNTGTFLAESLQMHCCFQPARKKIRGSQDGDVQSYSGLAVLSHQPHLAQGLLGLPCDSRDGDRWAQWLNLRLRDQRLMVINTHLTHLASEESLRQQQLEVIVSFAATKAGNGLVMMGGDLNTGSGEPAMNWLESQQILPAFNAWRETEAYPVSGTLVGEDDNACIDHLLRFSPAESKSNIHWSRCFTALGEADDTGTHASDHLAVVGELSC